MRKLFVLFTFVVLCGCVGSQDSTTKKQTQLCQEADLEFNTEECSKYIMELEKRLLEEQQKQIQERNKNWCAEVGLKFNTSECAQYIINKENQIMQNENQREQIDVLKQSNKIQERTIKCRGIKGNSGYGDWGNSFMRGFYGC